MRIHKVSQCCCGCSLETGTKIIAWLQIICGIILALLMITTTIVVKNHDSFTMQSGNYTTSLFPDSEDEPSGPPPPVLPATMFIGPIVGGIFSAIVGLILLIGATKRRPHLLNIWVVISIIALVLYGLGTLIQVIILMIAGLIVNGISVLVTASIGMLISYYYIMVVSSFRKEIMSGNNTV